MNRRSLQKFSRRWHRRLGVIIGIQFVFWTFGGFYFSWFHIDNVRGKYEANKQTAPNLRRLNNLVSIDQILKRSKLSSVRDIRVGMWQKKPVIRLYKNKDIVEMFDASDGKKLSPISKAQARQIATLDFTKKAAVSKIQRILKKGGEYKGPTPAYRVDFANAKSTHIYIHEGTGLITARRNAIWRGFDFLWMLHILDFKAREDINNWLLRILSVLGLITLCSGYLLWFVTSPLFRRKSGSTEDTDQTSGTVERSEC